VRARVAALATLSLLLAAPPAMAELPIFQGSAGALFTAGGDLWTEPDFPSAYEPYVDGVPFHDMAGGYGLGGGLFFEARFIKFIGLELGLLFEANRMWYDIEYTVGGFTAEMRYKMKYTAVRIPILVKGVFETRVMRVSLGLGPEIVLTRGDDGVVEELSDHGIDTSGYESLFGTKPQSDVFLCASIGFAFKVWKLSIPLNIRYSHNLTQPDGYKQRVGDVVAGDYDYTASQSMDLRLQLGLAYDF
jgi:hypothetical protein